MTPLLLALPWLLVFAFVVAVVRLPGELPPAAEGSRASSAGRSWPLVSVVVPARNEALNIEACVTSLVESAYPSFEVIVVDDASEDGTGALARSIGRGNARRLLVVDGEPLPSGWLGKPWACRQGAEQATGDLLLFTDADTRHGPRLLERAVSGLKEEDADLLTVTGRQLMGTFWERVVQPQVFLTMLFRFPRFESTAKNRRWRDAIANGQFMLFRRRAYDRIGGHAAVRDEVVEDLALAQRVKRAGMKLRVRSAETDLATRMYRSLGHLVEGWSKNIVMGGLQSVPRWSRPFVAPLALLVGFALWLLPPILLLVALATGIGGPALLLWSAVVYTLSVVVWAGFGWRMGVPAAYGLLYPLGAAVGVYIFLRSWVRGSRVEWKGRRYDLPSASDRA